MQANVDAIVEAGGIASINHPNYGWAFDHREISRVEGASLLGVFNGHPAVNLFGAPDKPSYEEIWDGVLSAGRVIFGVATDDSHNYHDFAPWLSNPGRGWVMVRADELTQEAIVDGLASGRFYATTGVTLTRLECSAENIVLEIDQDDFIYTTRFTGKDGVMLAESTDPSAEYRAGGHEDYVRATVISSSGPRAWTQPVFPTRAGLGRGDGSGHWAASTNSFASQARNRSTPEDIAVFISSSA